MRMSHVGMCGGTDTDAALQQLGGDASVLVATPPELGLVAHVFYYSIEGVAVLHLKLSRSLESLYAVTIE